MPKSIKMMEKIGIAIMLSFALALPVHAATSVSNQISDIQNKQNETKSNLNKTNDQIKEMQEAKTNLEGYLSDLNKQLSDLSAKLDDLESQISTKQKEIETTQAELEAAKKQENEQYAAMKMRIKFMYENGDDAYLAVFLEAKDISDLLNRAEYVTKIYDYDRDMLVKYQNTKNDIEEKEAQLKQEQSELLALQNQVLEKENEVTSLVSKTSSKVTSYSSKISSAQGAASQYEAELLKQEEKLETLKAKEAAEKQAAAKKKAQEEAAKKNSTTSSSSSSSSTSSGTTVVPTATSESASDLELLAAIIECESGSESTEGKIAVGSVVMNRVRSSAYPNTILGVIYQSGQFSPVTSGRFSIVLARGATSSCVSAAQQVLGGTSSGSWLHFCRANGIVQGDVIGNHVFY